MKKLKGISGIVVDYYGLASYLTSALDQFTQNDVQGALKELKDEIPKLDRAYNKVLEYFKSKYSEIIMDINLEEFTEKSELFSKKIFNFCELSWHENILNFYKRKDLYSK